MTDRVEYPVCFLRQARAGDGLYRRSGASLPPGGSAGGIFLSLLGTPLNIDHVDLDLMLDMSADGPALSDFHVAPSMESNPK